MKKIIHPSEVALCADAIERARKEDWTAHPEACEYDIVLVGHGLVVGVEAKLRQNLEVLRQAAGRRRHDNTPDYIVVLTSGHADRAFSVLCADLRLIHWSICPGYESLNTLLHLLDTAGEECRCDGAPLKLPGYASNSVAGSPAPIRLTDWKLNALRMFAIIEATGVACVADFKRLRLYPRSWAESGWVQRGAERGTYVAGPRFNAIPSQHPDAYASILAEVKAGGTRGGA
jgi:hypothetical protein